MTHRIAARYTTSAHVLRTRLEGITRDERGATMTEWLMLVSLAVIVAGLIYAAFQAFANRKIGILNGA